MGVAVAAAIVVVVVVVDSILTDAFFLSVNAVGEWGGQISTEPMMKAWGDALVEYMRARCLTSNFFWALNHDSAQTSGLLKQ